MPHRTPPNLALPDQAKPQSNKIVCLWHPYQTARHRTIPRLALPHAKLEKLSAFDAHTKPYQTIPDLALPLHIEPSKIEYAFGIHTEPCPPCLAKPSLTMPNLAPPDLALPLP